jgi:uncharacterized phiE125 gp8 family phage protein
VILDALHQPIHVGLTLTTGPTEEPVTLGLAKQWLRVSADDQDAIIAALITAARQKVEDDTGYALFTSTYTYAIDQAPAGGIITVPIAPLASVTSITSYSTADVSAVVAASVYRVDIQSVPGRIVLKDGQAWPTGLRPQSGLVVVCVAGHATIAAIPEPLVQAMRLLISQWYEQRESVIVGTTASEVPLAYDALIAPYRLRVTW